MKHSLALIRKIMRFGYEMFFATLLFCFLMIFFVKEQPPVKALYLVAAIFLVSYVARQWAPNYAVLLFFHAIPLVILYFSSVSRGTLGVLTAIDIYLFTDGIVFMKRNGVLAPLTDMPWPTFLISLIIYLFGYYTHSTLITVIAYLIPVIMLILYLGMIYVEGLYNYVDSTKDVTGLPLKEIIRTNTNIVSIIISLVVTAIVISELLHIDKAIVEFGKMLLALVKGFAYSIAFIWRLISALVSTGTTEGISYDAYTATGGSSYSGTFGNAILFIGKLLLGAFLLFILYKLLAKLVRIFFKRRNVNGDKLEIADKRSKSGVYYRNTNKRARKRLSDSEKIRKLYKLRIERYKYDVALNDRKTCRDIETEIENKGIGNVKAMTDIYAGVRYSDAEIDRSVLKKMKQLSKQ